MRSVLRGRKKKINVVLRYGELTRFLAEISKKLIEVTKKQIKQQTVCFNRNKLVSFQYL